MITDAGERSMLATCRALNAAGYTVSGAGFDFLAPTRWSRRCAHFVRVRDPRSDAGGFIDDLGEYLRRNRCELVIPGSDFTLSAISARRAELESMTNLGLPGHAIVERSLDRDSLAAAAVTAGFEAPPSLRCQDVTEAIAAGEELGFPVVIKSCRVVHHDGGRVIRGRPTLRVEDEAGLRQHVTADGEPFLIQRAVHGQTLSFAGVMSEGRLLGACMARYERTWPPTAGNAAYAVTIDIEPEVERAVTALVAQIGWQGIFEVELIRTDDGSLFPIDFNPRPYGSMALAVAAGANLPALWCEALCGLPSQLARARAGRRYRWEDAELLGLVWALRHRRLRLARDILSPARAVVHPHFQRADPLPMVARMAWLMAKALSAGRSPVSA